MRLTVFINGCERGVACNQDAPCFVAHPWSGTHETCLFSSAYMRAEHVEIEIERTHTGLPIYHEAIETMMKASLPQQG